MTPTAAATAASLPSKSLARLRALIPSSSMPEGNRYFYRASIETTIGPDIEGSITITPMKTLGERIALRISELDKSQYWLAKEAGIKQPSVNAIIKGAKAKGSSYLVPIARALGVHADWLWDETGSKLLDPPREALLVGYVGAGATVVRFEEGVVLGGGIEPPSGYDKVLVARIDGSSMFPLENGWLIFYGEEHRGIPDDCINKLCVIGLEDHTTMIKKLRVVDGKFRLESWNAEAIEDAKVIWASRVIDIRPT